MFKEIKDEKAFDGILNQIIDNIQNGHLKAGDALPAERRWQRRWEYPDRRYGKS